MCFDVIRANNRLLCASKSIYGRYTDLECTFSLIGDSKDFFISFSFHSLVLSSIVSVHLFFFSYLFNCHNICDYSRYNGAFAIFWCTAILSKQWIMVRVKDAELLKEQYVYAHKHANWFSNAREVMIKRFFFEWNITCGIRPWMQRSTTLNLYTSKWIWSSSILCW